MSTGSSNSESVMVRTSPSGSVGVMRPSSSARVRYRSALLMVSVTSTLTLRLSFTEQGRERVSGQPAADAVLGGVVGYERGVLHLRQYVGDTLRRVEELQGVEGR